jgi:hypothetical protein
METLLMSKDGFDPYKRNDTLQGNAGKGNGKQNTTRRDRTINLDSALKAQFERAFGLDLSDVRIHTGSFSDDITAKAQADAVTIGNDIYFHSGKYAPDTEEGRNLLAHELQHFLHFKNDKRMVYKEELEAIEEDAQLTEMMMSSLKLHHISSPSLNREDDFVANEDSDDVVDETKQQLSSPSALFKEFGKKGIDPRYRVYFTSTGKVYTVTKKEKEQAIQLAIKKYREAIDLEASLLPEGEREEFILRHLAFLSYGQ